MIKLKEEFRKKTEKHDNVKKPLHALPKPAN
jgi:hypothetical protein